MEQVAAAINAINYHARELRVIANGDPSTDIRAIDHHLQVVANYYSVLRRDPVNAPQDAELASSR